jgi:hypothetical protein
VIEMGWFLATYTFKDVGWKIVGKLILLTTISFIVGERLGISDMNIYYRLVIGIVVVLAVSGSWFFLTKIVPEQ